MLCDKSPTSLDEQVSLLKGRRLRACWLPCEPVPSAGQTRSCSIGSLRIGFS